MQIDLPFIAILRGATPDEILEHAHALADEGFAAIEVPTNSPNWQESVRRLAGAFTARPEVGAGTVLPLAYREIQERPVARRLVRLRRRPAEPLRQ